MDFRKGTEADLDAVNSLYWEVTGWLQRTVNYPGWEQGAYPARRDAETGIRSGTLYVAEMQGKTAGTMILDHTPEPAFADAKWQVPAPDAQVFILRTFAVHPAFQKAGLGRQMLACAEQLAQAQSVRAIRLDVSDKNLPAVRLYKACGYRYIGDADLGLGAYGLTNFLLYEKGL